MLVVRNSWSWVWSQKDQFQQILLKGRDVPTWRKSIMGSRSCRLRCSAEEIHSRRIKWESLDKTSFARTRLTAAQTKAECHLVAANFQIIQGFHQLQIWKFQKNKWELVSQMPIWWNKIWFHLRVKTPWSSLNQLNVSIWSVWWKMSLFRWKKCRQINLMIFIKRQERRWKTKWSNFCWKNNFTQSIISIRRQEIRLKLQKIWSKCLQEYRKCMIHPMKSSRFWL